MVWLIKKNRVEYLIFNCIEVCPGFIQVPFSGRAEIFSSWAEKDKSGEGGGLITSKERLVLACSSMPPIKEFLSRAYAPNAYGWIISVSTRRRPSILQNLTRLNIYIYVCGHLRKEDFIGKYVYLSPMNNYTSKYIPMITIVPE